MKYKAPADIYKHLTYNDKALIADWAKFDISLASMANIVLKSKSSYF